MEQAKSIAKLRTPGGYLLLLIFTLTGLTADRLPAADALRPEKPCSKVKATILQYGLARVDSTDPLPVDPGKLAAAHLFRPGSFEFLRQTRSIPLASGHWIYIRYRVENIPTASNPKFKYVVTHPPMQSPEGKTFTRYEDTFTPGSSVYEDFFGWGFDDRFPMEFVTGNWHFQLLYEDCVLYSQKFTTTQ